MTEFETATIAFQEATMAYQTATITYQNATMAYQTATIAFQEATVAYQNATVAYQNAVLGLRYAANWIAAGVGAGQIISIWVGFWFMYRNTEQRREEENMRHAESMRALQVLIRGLETVIERTAPRKT